MIFLAKIGILVKNRSCGKTSKFQCEKTFFGEQKIFGENSVVVFDRKILWSFLAEKICGRFGRKNSVVVFDRKILWPFLTEKFCGRF